MPCYEVRTVSVKFEVGNIDLLKMALVKLGFAFSYNQRDEKINLSRYSITIDLKNGSAKTAALSDVDLSKEMNSIKRAYSEVVIDEVAKRQKWMKKNMGKGQFQLQRF